jgi:hypothetical protein
MTAPGRSEIRRPRTAPLITALVVALVLVGIALALPWRSSAPSVTHPSGITVSLTPVGGGNEDHPRPRPRPHRLRTVSVGPANGR